jgi:transposase
MNQIKSLVITGPAQLREQMRHLPTLKLIAACARLSSGHQLGDTEYATQTALRRLARRH